MDTTLVIISSYTLIIVVLLLLPALNKNKDADNDDDIVDNYGVPLNDGDFVAPVGYYFNNDNIDRFYNGKQLHKATYIKYMNSDDTIVFQILRFAKERDGGIIAIGDKYWEYPYILKKIDMSDPRVLQSISPI